VTAKTKHALAGIARARKVERLTALYGACRCEWPLVNYRNCHGHGKTVAGEPCPAIAIWEAQRAEAEESLALAEHA
jgi:hypothetical protein